MYEPPYSRAYRRRTPWSAASTATNRPLNPFEIEANRNAANRQFWDSSRPQLSGPRSAPAPVQESLRTQHARREALDKAIDYGDKMALTLPIPYVGETVGVAGALVGSGARLVRAVDKTRQGDYLSAGGDVALAALGGTVGGGARTVRTTQARVAEQNKAVSMLAEQSRSLNSPLGSSVKQAEADEGANFTRQWIEERAKAGMGGLTPEDAKLAQRIHRPVVADEDTWSKVGFKTAHGFYVPQYDVAAVAPSAANVKSTAVHESAHQWQITGQHTPGMKQGLDLIQKTIPTGGTVNKSDLATYMRDPHEVHARLMEVRSELGLKPTDYVTKEMLPTPSTMKGVVDLATQKKSLALSELLGTIQTLQHPERVDWLRDMLNKTPGVLLPVAGAAAVGMRATQPNQKAQQEAFLRRIGVRPTQ